MSSEAAGVSEPSGQHSKKKDGYADCSHTRAADLHFRIDTVSTAAILFAVPVSLLTLILPPHLTSVALWPTLRRTLSESAPSSSAASSPCVAPSSSSSTKKAPATSGPSSSSPSWTTSLRRRGTT